MKKKRGHKKKSNRGRRKGSGILSGIKPRSQTWSNIRNTIIYGTAEWQMIVLQELVSAPKVTLQEKDGRLIENLKENLVAQFERALLNRDAGWFERKAKAIRWNDRRTKSQKERAAFNRKIILLFEQAYVRQGNREDLTFTPAGKFTDAMASDIYKALKKHELPNGHLKVENCRFENKERTMEAIRDLAKRLQFALKKQARPKPKGRRTDTQTARPLR
jgi:hypothetical protein